MGRTAATVLLVDRANNEDDIAGAKFLYGCNGRSCLVVASSLDQMARQLRTYDSIGRLVFREHGFAGHILIDGIPVRLRALAQQLIGIKMVVSESIHFDSCDIAERPAEMLPLLDALQAPKGVGFVGSYFPQHTKIVVAKGDSADELERKLRRVRDYLLPNQPTPAELVKTPGEKFLFMEYWSQSGSASDERMLSRVLSGQSQVDRLHFPSRKDLQRKSIPGTELPSLFDTREPVLEVTVTPPFSLLK